MRSARYAGEQATDDENLQLLLGELANVRVEATSQTDPKDATALVHSNELPIGLKVVAGTKPPLVTPVGKPPSESAVSVTVPANPLNGVTVTV